MEDTYIDINMQIEKIIRKYETNSKRWVVHIKLSISPNEII